MRFNNDREMFPDWKENNKQGLGEVKHTPSSAVTQFKQQWLVQGSLEVTSDREQN